MIPGAAQNDSIKKLCNEESVPSLSFPACPQSSSPHWDPPGPGPTISWSGPIYLKERRQ